MKQITKIDPNTVQIVTDVTPSTTTSTYIYDDLVAQLNQLIQSKTSFNLQVDQAIADLQDTLKQADSLGVISKT